MKVLTQSYSNKIILPLVILVLSTCTHTTERNIYDIDRLQQEFLDDHASEKLLWIEVPASTNEERTTLAEHGLSLERIDKETVYGIIPEDLIDYIERAGFVIKSKTPIDEFIALDALKYQSAAFLRYNQVHATLQQLAREHSDVASLISMGKSVQGRELWTLRINTTEKGTQPSKKIGSVFIGTIHAREHLATTVALELAVWLCINKKTIHPLISQRDIYITPLINPDGSDYDLTGNPYRYFRKNMRVNYDKKIGVDLNRNFGYGWGGRGSSNITGSETYRGPYAFSEPESCALKNFLESKRNVKTFVSYHSYGELILYPWGNTHQPIENPRDRKLHEEIAVEMARITGYKPQQASRLYIAAGDTTDWTYSACRLISFTIELFPKQYGRINGSGFYPTEQDQIQKTIQNNIKAALYLIESIGQS